MIAKAPPCWVIIYLFTSSSVSFAPLLSMIFQSRDRVAAAAAPDAASRLYDSLKYSLATEQLEHRISCSIAIPSLLAPASMMRCNARESKTQKAVSAPLRTGADVACHRLSYVSGVVRRVGAPGPEGSERWPAAPTSTAPCFSCTPPCTHAIGHARRWRDRWGHDTTPGRRRCTHHEGAGA